MPRYRGWARQRGEACPQGNARKRVRLEHCSRATSGKRIQATEFEAGGLIGDTFALQKG